VQLSVRAVASHGLIVLGRRRMGSGRAIAALPTKMKLRRLIRPLCSRGDAIDYQFSGNLHRFAAMQWADVGRGLLWVIKGALLAARTARGRRAAPWAALPAPAPVGDLHCREHEAQHGDRVRRPSCTPEVSRVDMIVDLIRQRGGAMLSGAKSVGRPSMLCIFFRPQYFLRLSMPCPVQ